MEEQEVGKDEEEMDDETELENSSEKDDSDTEVVETNNDVVMGTNSQDGNSGKNKDTEEDYNINKSNDTESDIRRPEEHVNDSAFDSDDEDTSVSNKTTGAPPVLKGGEKEGNGKSLVNSIQGCTIENDTDVDEMNNDIVIATNTNDTNGPENDISRTGAVSYTHLTLPTICSV